jgi:hypothetical protein
LTKEEDVEKNESEQKIQSSESEIANKEVSENVCKKYDLLLLYLFLG